MTEARIETAEARAWLDMYEAVPPDFQRRFNPEIARIGDVVLTRCRAIPFPHFNSVLTLGVSSPATEEQVDEVVAWYRGVEIPRFTVLHNPHCQPAQLTQWLEERGLQSRGGGWERVYRPAGASFTAPPPEVPGSVDFVTPDTAGEWAGFLDARYGLPTGPWLTCLAGRPGWSHAVLRQEGKIVAARSLFRSADGWAWMGVEAPVPGLMAPSYAEDYAVTYTLVREALRSGVEAFVADIEAPSSGRDTPAYARWESLGFTCPYIRRHYVSG
jgi:hypothetical protein